ncbi:Alpha-xylosidase [Hordeum vulgare]|nr:Alpha-xylosidase [Hordeum vulgare]
MVASTASSVAAAAADFSRRGEAFGADVAAAARSAIDTAHAHAYSSSGDPSRAALRRGDPPPLHLPQDVFLNQPNVLELEAPSKFAEYYENRLKTLDTLKAAGFHQCRWGYHNLSVVEDVVENYWSAQIPLDVIWNDDDHMDARKDLTLSPVNYSRPKLLAFLDMLQFHWNQYDRNSCIFFHEYVSGIDKCDRNQYQMNYQNAIFDFSKLV